MKIDPESADVRDEQVAPVGPDHGPAHVHAQRALGPVEAHLEVLRVAAAARGERVGGRREPEDLEEFPNLEDSLVLPSFKQFEFLQHIAAFKSATEKYR